MESNVALITRIKANDNKEIYRFKEWLNVFIRNNTIKEIYILCDEVEKYKSILNNKKVAYLLSDSPTSPTAANQAIDEISKSIDFFIIASKEIYIENQSINDLISELEKNSNLLVAGYKFKLDDFELNNELENYYSDEKSIAYKVPWNTFAIWNRNLFNRFVKEFDRITDNMENNKLIVWIDSEAQKVDRRGMEDGLAIAKSVSKNIKVKYRLMRKTLNWNISKKHDKVKQHREKLARKDKVLRYFMKKKGYDVEALRKSSM